MLIDAINNVVFPTAEWIVFAFTLHFTLSKAQRKIHASIIIFLSIAILAFAVHLIFPPIRFVIIFIQVSLITIIVCFIYNAPPFVAAFFCFAVNYISVVADMLMGNLMMALYGGDILSALEADQLLRLVFNIAAKLIQIFISIAMIKGFRKIHWEIPAIYWIILDTILVFNFLCILGYASATPYLQTQIGPWILLAGMVLFFLSDIFTATLFAALSNHYTKKQLEYVANLTKARLDNDMLSFEQEKAAVRRMRHDQTNSLNNLALMIRDGEAQEALCYITELTDKIPNTEIEQFTGIGGIDTMISMKFEAAKAHNIKFSINTDLLPPYGLSVVSVATILSNLLDNAIESNIDLRPSERYIELRCYVHKAVLNILITNPYKVAPLKVNNRLITRKGDLEAHGNGTGIVREICEDHKGNFIIKYEKGIFTAHASLLLEKDKITTR